MSTLHEAAGNLRRQLMDEPYHVVHMGRKWCVRHIMTGYIAERCTSRLKAKEIADIMNKGD